MIAPLVNYLRAGRIGGRDRGGPGRPVPALATGTISTGTFLLGPSWPSRALLAAASAGLVVLGAALTARLVFFRSSVAADIKAPERVFGFFTITAGLDVLGVRLALARHPLATAILAGLTGAAWLVPAWPSQTALLASVAAGQWCPDSGVRK